MICKGQAYSDFFSGVHPLVPCPTPAAAVERDASDQGAVQLSRLYTGQGALFFRLHPIQTARKKQPIINKQCTSTISALCL